MTSDKNEKKYRKDMWCYDFNRAFNTTCKTVFFQKIETQTTKQNQISENDKINY